MSDVKRSRTSTSTSQQPIHLDDNAWSHIVKFMATSAWNAAIDVSNMTRTCKAWKANQLWTHYASALGIFTFQTMPFPVKALFLSASERDGFVNQKTIMEHLKLNATYLKNVDHKTLRLGMGRKMYLYDIGDVLRAATKRFKTVEAMEKHIQKCKQAQLSRIKNQQARERRSQEVQQLLESIKAGFILRTNNTSFKEMHDYVDKNLGSLDIIRTKALEMKKAYDIEQARLMVINKRRSKYQQWVKELRLSHGKYQDHPIVRRFIHEGLGTKEEVVAAVLQAFKEDQERYMLKMQQASGRRAALIEELAAHGLELRSDSAFCRDYIRGTTTASLPEVVATMKLTSFLFSVHYRAWSMWHKYLENAMKTKMQSGQHQCWYAACEDVIETNIMNVQNGDYFSDYESDYYDDVY